MSTVVVIGGGPRPNAQIYAVSPVTLQSALIGNHVVGDPEAYEIREANDVLVHCQKLSHAVALLPLIQSGE